MTSLTNDFISTCQTSDLKRLIYRRGGAGGAGGAIAPPNIEVGGLSPPLRYHQVQSYCERVFFEIAVLSVTVSLNRVSLASQTSLLTIDITMDWGLG